VLYFRWAISFAIFAFLVSVGLGLISGVTVWLAIVRGIVFATFFFGLGFALRFLVTNYFPELFLPRDATESQYPEEKKPPIENMTIDATGEYAVPELYKAPGGPNELGNIEDLISGTFIPLSESVDRMEEGGYNERGYQSEVESKYNTSIGADLETMNFQDMFGEVVSDFGEPKAVQTAEKKDFTPSLGDDSDGLGGLPDLDSMATAFGGVSSSSDSGGISSFGIDEESAPADHGNIESSESRYIGNKPQPLKGDFNPKDLARGISTVLTKEK
jgi:hypothetical protein